MIYLDHAATAPIPDAVVDAMLPWFQWDHIGNASSIHTQGARASRAVENAREQVANMINADPSEIYFTSGGTESNNTALHMANGFVLTSRLEHHSVLDCVQIPGNGHSGVLQDGKFTPVEPIHIECDESGRVDVENLEALIKQSKTVKMVSAMWVNNELGTINPIEEIGEICKRYSVLFHSDAVAAAGHTPIDVKAANVDLLSISGHKFGAPPGVGALFIRNNIPTRPLLLGGGQERGMRAGSLNVPGIVGMGRAAELVAQELNDHIVHWSFLESLFYRAIEDELPGEHRINASKHRSHNIISLTIPSVNSESLLLLLDSRGIYLSAGSACSASDAKPSHVLKGIGLSDEDAASTVRISMGYNTTEADMLIMANAIADAAHRLRNMYP